LCSVIEDNGEYYLSSTQFGTLPDAGVVRAGGVHLVQLVNGASRIHNPSFEGVTAGRVVRIDDAGTREHFVFLSGTITARSRVSARLTVSNTEEDKVVSPPLSAPTKIAAAVKGAMRDPKVNKALRLFSTARDWADLYRVFEVIKSDVGGDKGLVSRGWISGRKASLFTSTANNPGAIGDAARHGHSAQQPPPKPMTLTEARGLIRHLLANWLQTKIDT
jgi:hypothetical protein